MKLNIFLDDLRYCPDEFELFSTAEELLDFLHCHPNIEIGTLSLDHDLGEDVMSGYDFVKQLETTNIKSIDVIQFHTDNYEGFRNMATYCKNLQRFEIVKISFVDTIKKNCIDGEFTNSFWKL